MKHRRPLLIALVGLLAACDEPASDDPWEEEFPGAEASPDLGGKTPEVGPAFEVDPADNDACVACHDEEAAAWEGSLHQRAFVEPAFQRSYAREPLAFCRGCHAPRADPREEPSPTFAQQGVDCVSCHVRDGLVHTGPSHGRDPSPHALVRSETFGEDACASCHEFEFPPEAHRRPGTLMQKTMREHEASAHAELTCSSCHFPRTEGRANHGLSISRNESLLRKSLVAEAERTGPGSLRLTLEPVGVGHRFPTGDLFRRIEIEIEARDAEGRIVDRQTRHLARHFVGRSDGHGRLPAEADDRLAGRASFDLGLSRARAADLLIWRVTYQRVDSRNHEHPERSRLAGEVQLAAGELP